MIGEGTYVTMEKPCSGIIRSPSDHDLTRGRDGDCISPCWVLLIFNKRRVYGWVVGSDVEGLGDYLELVTDDQLTVLLHDGKRRRTTYPWKWNGWNPSSQLYTVN